MPPFTKVTTLAVPFDEPNVDTNQLCPTRFNKVPRGPRYADILFHDRRFTATGEKRPEFILNQEPYTKAGIMVADRNFGCGSSRETAVYALVEFGFRAVIASSYGDIFYNSCFKVGVLPVIVAREICVHLRAQLYATIGASLTVDLEKLVICDVAGVEHPFHLHELRRRSLLNGLDDVELTESFAETTIPFEAVYRAKFPWLYANEAQGDVGNR
jgi:3-isopropylmalate/(R)-2-methylmalate dehydratase small subunit